MVLFFLWIHDLLLRACGDLFHEFSNDALYQDNTQI